MIPKKTVIRMVPGSRTVRVAKRIPGIKAVRMTEMIPMPKTLLEI